MKIFITLIFSFIFCIVQGQSKLSDNLFVKGEYLFGAVIPEYSFFHYLVNDYTRSFEISLEKESSGKNPVEQIYKYPTYGLSLLYSSLGNNEVFGKLWGLYPYFRGNIVNFKRFRFQYQVGVGMSYVTKKFDFQENYQNVAAGSHFNIHFNAKIDARIQLSSKLFMHSGLAFNHYSNANMQEPNLGLNLVSFTNGLSYRIGQKTERIYRELPEFKPKTIYNLSYSIGSKHTRTFSSISFFVSSLSFEAKREISRIYLLGLGADIFHDTSVKNELEIANNSTYTPKDAFKTGIHISQTLKYGRFTGMLQLGIYVGLKDKVSKSAIYNRGTIRYRISKKMFTHLSMKSHLHILDHPEIGVGLIL